MAAGALDGHLASLAMAGTPQRPQGSGFARREALLAGTGGALALGLAACGFNDGEDAPDEPEPAPEQTDSELEALAGLAALERRAILTYESGARFSGTRQAREFSVLSNQSKSHVGALDLMIVDAGGTEPSTEPAPGTTFIRDQDSALRETRFVARQLIEAYLDVIPFQSSVDRRRSLTTMLANDAQHLIVLGGLPASVPLPGADPEDQRLAPKPKSKAEPGETPEANGDE